MAQNRCARSRADRCVLQLFTGDWLGVGTFALSSVVDCRAFAHAARSVGDRGIMAGDQAGELVARPSSSSRHGTRPTSW